MHIRISGTALAALTLVLASCSDNVATTRPSAFAVGGARFSTGVALPPVRVSEIHYDNAGTDVGEAIEISGPAGTDLTGWSLVLYNGSGGASYTTTTLTGSIPATCGTRGVVVLNYPSNGIQNGSPDGLALVNGTSVVEFLSYEGTFTAANGPAAGTLSTDIGVQEAGTETPGLSLQRSGNGTWTGPIASTFGACNDADVQPLPDVAMVSVVPDGNSIARSATQQFTATAAAADGQPVPASFTWTSDAPTVASVDASSGLATGLTVGAAHITATTPNGKFASALLHVTDAPPPPALPDTRISELHYDNVGTDAGEAIEIEGPAGTNLSGWSIVLYDGNGGAPYNTTNLSGSIPAMTSCGARGVVVVNYPVNGIQNGSPDGMALVKNDGTVVEFLSYEGVMTAAGGPANGLTSVDIGVSESSAPVGQSLQRDAAGAWSGPRAATFGSCNGDTAAPSSSITFSGRDATADPPLPIGFEDQIFATEHSGGAVVATTITWSSDTPAIAGVDQNGVIHALQAGTAVFRATATDGTTSTYMLPTRVAVASTTARYGHNAEFGEPADADPSDDFIVRRDQYTASYNRNRGTPNWVSYEINATDFGSEDRCDCFTMDPQLPSSFTHLTTADYTGAGAFAGYGIDRGHLARSFDRTSASLDNATTFYFTNMIPQASDLNQGPWAVLENYLGDQARLQNEDVYVIAGVAGNKGSVKGENRITIPASVWKVALILPRDHGLADVHDYTDVQAIAVIMPNEPGVRNVDWHTYQTTVDAVEALSGYDLLALLPDRIERAVESNTQPPFAVVNGPFASTEGASVAMSGSASHDPNGSVTGYLWSFGDGASASGATVSHTYAQDGEYAVRLIVTDNDGLVDTAFTTAHVANVPPAIAAFGGATLLPGETYAVQGSFADPGADPWSATVDYGDGSGANTLSLAGFSFSLSHTYDAPGAFTVAVQIADDHVTSSRTAAVTVLTPVQAVDNAISLVQQLPSGSAGSGGATARASDGGALQAGNVNSLIAKLQAARQQLERGTVTPAAGQLGSVVNELDAMLRSGRLAPSQGAPVETLVERVIRSITR